MTVVGATHNNDGSGVYARLKKPPVAARSLRRSSPGKIPLYLACSMALLPRLLRLRLTMTVVEATRN